MNAFMADMQLDPLPEVAAVEMLDATGPELSLTVPIRLYRPKTAGTGALPITVYFYAGGYVFGDLDGMESLCRLLCREAGCLVALVECRLAPEGKFPAAHEDAYAATCWIAENAAAIGADPERIAVAGNSSGGTPAICQQML